MNTPYPKNRFFVFALASFMVAALCFVNGAAGINGFEIDATVPPANELDVDPATVVGADFTADVDTTTVDGDTFVVHGGFSGVRGGTFAFPAADQARFTPDAPFFPGEKVAATATTAIASSGASNLAPPVVWEFTAAVGTGNDLGSGQFAATPQLSPGWDGNVVTSGDVDNDGDLDALVGRTAGAASPVGVFINDGAGQFAFNGQQVTINKLDEVVLADFDADGDLDALIGGRDVAPTLWLGSGDGTFAIAATNPPFPGTPRSTGDVDGDGNIDVLIVNGSQARLWFNDGTGQFTQGDPQPLAGYNEEHGLADLDGDNDLDVILLGLPTRLFINDGSGTLTAGPELAAGGYAHRLHVGDLDADGDLDLLLRALPDAEVDVWLNDGAGSFSLDATVALTQPGNRSALGDLDGDGDLDLLLPPDTLRNDGTGSFMPAKQTLLQTGADLAPGDLDGDGDLDALLSQALNAADAGVWLNIDREELSPMLVTATDPAANAIDVDLDAIIGVDFNMLLNPPTVTPERFIVRGGLSPVSTGTIDAAGSQATYTPTLPFKPGEVVVTTLTKEITSAELELLQPYSWQFTAETLGGTGHFMFEQGLGDGGDSYAALADVDADGDVDALVANEPGADFVWNNLGNGRFARGPGLPVSGSAILAGDLDGDGDLDAFVSGGATGFVVLNDGAGIFSAGQTVAVAARAAALADLDNDGDLDLLLGTDVPSGSQIWLNDGSGTFADSGSTFGDANLPNVLAAADVDGDGDMDVIVAHDTGATIWTNDGAGALSKGYSLAMGRTCGDIGVGDLDGDGDLDLLFTTNTAATLWYNDGAGVFADPVFPPVMDRAAIGDVDGDGDLDIFGTGTSNRRVLFNDGSGRVFSTLLLPPSGQPCETVRLADLDGDGDLDAFLAQRAGAVNQVWLNKDVAVFAPVVAGE